MEPAKAGFKSAEGGVAYIAIKAVLFDFDGTLADTLPLTFKAFKTVFKVYDGRDVTNEQLISMFGPAEEEIIANNFKNTSSILQASDDYYSIYKDGHIDSLRNDESIVALLNLLKAQRKKIGIVTGKSKRAFQISSEGSGFIQFL